MINLSNAALNISIFCYLSMYYSMATASLTILCALLAPLIANLAITITSLYDLTI